MESIGETLLVLAVGLSLPCIVISIMGTAGFWRRRMSAGDEYDLFRAVVSVLTLAGFLAFIGIVLVAV